MYANTRSMNADLHEGTTDGKYKKVVRDRGGVVENLSNRERSDLYDIWYGIHETSQKTAGDGVSSPTPYYVPTRISDPAV